MFSLPHRKVLSCSLLALCVAWTTPSFGMEIPDHSEKNQSLKRKAENLLDSKTNPEENESGTKKRKENSESSAIETYHINQLLPEMLETIFGYLSPKSLSRGARVCTLWNKISSKPILWNMLLQQLDINAPKLVNPKSSIIHVFKASFVNSLTPDLLPAENHELALLGYTGAIEREIKGLASGQNGYPVDLVTAKSLNEVLVDKNNTRALNRKVIGLTNGTDGYQKDLKAAMLVNEELVALRNDEAIDRKIDGLTNGTNGYRKDREAAMVLTKEKVANYLRTSTEEITWFSPQELKHAASINDELIAQGDLNAIRRKIRGLKAGDNGYKRDRNAAITFNEEFVARGNPEAINRKIEWLERPITKSKKDSKTAKVLNEKLVAQGDLIAIRRKITGLATGTFGYQKDLKAAMILNEELVSQKDLVALNNKVTGLLKGNNGYQKDLEAAKETIKELVALGDEEDPKSQHAFTARLNWVNASMIDPGSKEFIEELVALGDPSAIKKKKEGLTFGNFVYVKNIEALREFEEKLVALGNWNAIKDKIRMSCNGGYVAPKDPAFFQKYLYLLK